LERGSFDARVELGASVSGLVKEVFADRGDAVTAGQIVAELDLRTWLNQTIGIEGGLSLLRKSGLRSRRKCQRCRSADHQGAKRRVR
ncbi:biotin/lipoyl-binding protein, partial [Mesorhizobium sp. M7A.F.Ca.CA.001.13.2.1]